MIFIECIPSLVLESPVFFDNGMHPQQVRARLGQVCRVWSAILNDEPGVWETLVFANRFDPPEIVSLWIKRSKSHPLDISFQGTPNMFVYGNAVVRMLHKELWRIRSFIGEDFLDTFNISPLFPPNFSTEAPMLQNLSLHCIERFTAGRLAWIHCPQLCTLTLQNCGEAMESLMSKPMQNLRVLTIANQSGDPMLYIKLLQALPNLVSLTWWNFVMPLHDEIPRVVLRSLKSLTLYMGPWDVITCLYVPSLEHLEINPPSDPQGSLDGVLDIICGDGAVQLRRLTLGDGALRGANFHAVWHHLKHLETLYISKGDADELFIALSPRNRDFSSVCPQLKTLELSFTRISTGPLLDFVQRRVKPDLGDQAPGLVTCLKLSHIWVDEEVSAQLAKTHSLSVQTHHLLHLI